MLRLAAACLLCLACDEREPPKARTEPWENPAFRAAATASSIASAAPVAAQRYLLASSDVRFSLPARERTPQGVISGASGELELGADGVSVARCELRFDMTTLAVRAEDDAGDQAAYTQRALEWLELGSSVAPSTRERHRFATLEVSALERVEEQRVAASFRATAVGRLSLHGFRVPVEAAITFERSGDRLVVRSARPLLDKLAEHDLRPRNAEGHLVGSELTLLGTRVGREARVDFQLVFTAAPALDKNKQ
jgi:hypothetical protein